MIRWKFCLYVISLGLFSYCSADSELKTEEANTTIGAQNTAPAEQEQLNVTVLLDLSDRVEPSKYPASPEHADRDIEIVKYLTHLFKDEMEDKGAYMAKGKMKVIFSPRPEDSEINEIASRLNVDLSKQPNAQAKKKVFDSIEETFNENLRDIYSKVIETKKYPGSDVWRFFKNDVKDYAIDRDSNYRNVLVVLTDGYLFHTDSRNVEGNRTAHLTPQSLQARGLRGNNWRANFDDRDFGYITSRNDLENLEILVLEVNPTPGHKSDEDVIKAYLSKWFDEMGVNKYKIYNSDLPEYTKSRIDDFFQS